MPATPTTWTGNRNHSGTGKNVSQSRTPPTNVVTAAMSIGCALVLVA